MFGSSVHFYLSVEFVGCLHSLIVNSCLEPVAYMTAVWFIDALPVHVCLHRLVAVLESVTLSTTCLHTILIVLHLSCSVDVSWHCCDIVSLLFYALFILELLHTVVHCIVLALYLAGLSLMLGPMLL